MVDLETTVPDDTPPSNATSQLCRLCLQHDQSSTDIFEEKLPEQQQAPENQKPLVERLFDLLQIKYERSSSLPNNICQRCLRMVNAFSNFRENVQLCESELQRWLLNSRKRANNEVKDERPGLNGNPGVFEPEEDCLITEVDPEQDYESSEDDFSMESDSEIEDTTPHSAPAITSNANIPTDRPNSAGKPMEVAAPPTLDDSNAAPSLSSTTDMPGFAAPSGLSESGSLELVAKNTYLCQYCDMAFTTQAECTEHESQHDSAAPYKCSFCSQRTSSRPNLIYHIKELHDPERPYICALCGKGFCRRSDLKKHTIVHTGVRPFTCPVCAKSFSRNTNLTKHMRIHSSVKPHVCQRCPRSFSSAAELIRHARSHTETKPFQCNRCPASFTRRDKLQLHEQAHFRRDSEFLLNQAKVAMGGIANPSLMSMSAEQLTANAMAAAAVAVNQMENIVVPLNPFAEHEAGATGGLTPAEAHRRQSLLAAQLQQQQQQRAAAPKPSPAPKQTHPRIFTCNICSKTFTRERDLQRHQALHLDSLFTCKQCGTGFNRREKLMRHEQEFHAPQYPCSICRITFSKRDELEMHLKMHELQQTAAMATQAAINAASGTTSSVQQSVPVVPPLVAPPAMAKELAAPQRPSESDISFYSQLVPTMNLGFYSETRPEDRNGL